MGFEFHWVIITTTCVPLFMDVNAMDLSRHCTHTSIFFNIDYDINKIHSVEIVSQYQLFQHFLIYMYLVNPTSEIL